jgi:hypothetical protein
MILRVGPAPGTRSPQQTLAGGDADSGERVPLTANSRSARTPSLEPDNPHCEITADHVAASATQKTPGAAPTNDANSSNQLFLTRDKAASYLRSVGYPITPQRLAKLAGTSAGPEYRRWGNRVLYDLTSLIKWAKDRESTPQRPTHHPTT